jgi:PAS domain-containing protein
MENIIKDIKFLIIIFILLLVISIFLFIYYAYKVLKNKVELEKLKNALDIIVITDIKHKIKYVNYGFQKSTGYSIQEVIGEKPSILNSGLHKKEFYNELNEIIYSLQVH